MNGSRDVEQLHGRVGEHVDDTRDSAWRGQRGLWCLRRIMLGSHLHRGSLLFEGVDQIDLIGPFEVLSLGLAVPECRRQLTPDRVIGGENRGLIGTSTVLAYA